MLVRSNSTYRRSSSGVRAQVPVALFGVRAQGRLPVVGRHEIVWDLIGDDRHRLAAALDRADQYGIDLRQPVRILYAVLDCPSVPARGDGSADVQAVAQRRLRGRVHRIVGRRSGRLGSSRGTGSWW